MDERANRGPAGEPEPYVPQSGAYGNTGDLVADMWMRPNPGLDDVNDIFEYALTLDGYGYAREVLGLDLMDRAPDLLGEWRGPRRSAMTYVELRLLLFWEQRAAHWNWQAPSSGPTEGDLRHLRELNHAICEAWAREWPIYSATQT